MVCPRPAPGRRRPYGQNDSLCGRGRYLFGDDKEEVWDGIFGAFVTPEFFREADRIAGFSPTLSFGIGASGTGVPFHIHGPGFSETLWGKKRWFIMKDGPALLHLCAAKEVCACAGYFELTCLHWMRAGKRPQFDPNETTLAWLEKEYRPRTNVHGARCAVLFVHLSWAAPSCADTIRWRRGRSQASRIYLSASRLMCSWVRFLRRHRVIPAPKTRPKLTARRAQMRARAGRVHFFPQQLVPRYAEPRGDCLYVYVHMMQAENPWVAAVQCRGTEWSCGEIVRVRERAGGKNEVAWKGSDSRAGAPGLCHKSRFFVTEPRPSWMMPFQRST